MAVNHYWQTQNSGSGEVEDGSITTQKLAQYAVTNDKLALGSVDHNKIAGGAVTTIKILNGAVTPDKTSDEIVKVTGATFTGTVTVPDNADASKQVRNISWGTSVPSSLANGEIYFQVE